MSRPSPAMWPRHEDPAEPLRRALLAYWLASVDVMPAVASAAAEEKATDAALDLDDEVREMEDGLDAEAALRDAWADLLRSLEWIVNPTSRLDDARRAELQAEADRAWREAQPIARALEDALMRRRKAAEVLGALRRHERGTLRLSRAESRYVKARAEARKVLTDAIGRGLERRLGLFLRGDDGRLFCLLLDLGGEVPPRISVCEGCGLVFRPKRRYAARCARCHSKPRTPAFEYRRLERGGRVLFSPAGALRDHVCRNCGCRFQPSRVDAAYCSGRCRQAARRRRPAA